MRSLKRGRRLKDGENKMFRTERPHKGTHKRRKENMANPSSSLLMTRMYSTGGAGVHVLPYAADHCHHAASTI